MTTVQTEMQLTQFTAEPLDPEMFMDATGRIVECLKETTGQTAEIPGDTRALVPLIGVLEPYPRELLPSILLRADALHALIQSGALEKWAPQHHNGEIVHIHVAAAEVAATLPLTEEQRFPAAAFLAQVEETARLKYPDEDEGDEEE